MRKLNSPGLLMSFLANHLNSPHIVYIDLLKL